MLKEVVVMEEEVAVLVVVVLILMETSTIMLSLLPTVNLSLIHKTFKVFRVCHKDHNVRFVAKVVILLLTITTGWIFPFKESMLHPSLLPW